MAAVDVGARHNPPAQADELDDLFNYEVPDDIFKDVDINIDAPSKSKVGPSGDGKENGGGLGLDEEIKVTKRRAPVPKLDEDRYGQNRPFGNPGSHPTAYCHKLEFQN